MKHTILIICLTFSFSLSGYSQCPEREKIPIMLDEIVTRNDKKQITKELNDLILICKKCRYNNDSTFAKSFHVLGRTLWKENKIDSAISMTKMAIQINSGKASAANYANTCHSYFNLGCIYNELGQIKPSIAMFEKAIQVASKYPEKTPSSIGSHTQLAIISAALGDYSKSIMYSEKAYALAEKILDKDLMANSLMTKSQALLALSNDNDAEVVLSKADRLTSTSENESLKGSIYSVLADLKVRHHKNQQAIYFYKKAYNSSLKSGYEYGCAQAANNLGFFYCNSLNDFQSALSSYNLALTHTSHPWTRAVIFNSIAEVYTKKGNLQKSLIYNHKAITATFAGFENLDAAKNPPAVNWKSSVEKASLLPVIQAKADIWLKIAQTKKQNNAELRNALNTYMLADTMVDYMRWEHSGAVSKLFWRDKTRSLYENAIEACYLLNDPEKAFYFFEKSRAVLLNDQLNELAANKMLSPEDLKKENQHQKNILDIQNQLSEVDTPELREKLFAALRAQEAFVGSLEQRNPRYYAYKYDNRVPKLKDFSKNELEERQVFLSYFIGDKGVYSMLISKNGSSIRKIDLADYEKALTDFQKLVSDQEGQNQHFDQYLSSASELYRLLIKPLAIPTGSRIIVSPDGDFLPYGALSKSATTPQYLIRDYAFSYAYSARSLAKRMKRSYPLFSSHTFLGFAPVNFSPKLSQASLPGSEEALNIIDGHFSFSKLLTGQEANRQSFLEKAPDYRIVQVLTHAKAGNTDIAPTLYFADSTIKLSELSAIQNAKTELMVLSACETGIGKVQNGEGVFSLARGFAGLGIPSAVTTLWSLENKSVYELTQSFYDGLDDGNDLDIAIQKAQIKWLDSGSKGKQLPYYWAGILIVGNTEPINTGSSLTLICIFTGILLSVIIIYLISRRIKSAKLRGEKLSMHLPSSSFAKMFIFLFRKLPFFRPS